MGFLDVASYNSIWNGLYYYESKKVRNVVKIDEYTYSANVDGTETYNVVIDIRHPKKSTCNCPYSANRMIVCKHKIATYFMVCPEEAKELVDERQRYKNEAEEYYNRKAAYYADVRKNAEKYVNSLTKEQLKKELVDRIVNDMDYPYQDDEFEDYY